MLCGGGRLLWGCLPCAGEVWGRSRCSPSVRVEPWGPCMCLRGLFPDLETVVL